MVNHMILQGRLVADPEISTKGDLKYCRFRVAWSKTYKEKETKLFLSCVAFRHTAEFIGKYFRKGQQIVIEGQLETDTWEKDGEKRSSVKMNVESAHFCGDKKSNDNSHENSHENFDEITPLDDLPW